MAGNSITSCDGMSKNKSKWRKKVTALVIKDGNYSNGGGQSDFLCCSQKYSMRVFCVFIQLVKSLDAALLSAPPRHKTEPSP